MTRPRALDLCCCAGGVSMGLYQAGFDVVGVDVKYHKNYPFPQIVMDALDIESVLNLKAFDFIWGSPPCQLWSVATPERCRKNHPDLIQPIREILHRSGRLYAIENVPQAPVRADIILNGVNFGLPLERRRIFEVNFETDALQVGAKTRPDRGAIVRPSSGANIEAPAGANSASYGRLISAPAIDRHFAPTLQAQLGLPKAVSVAGKPGGTKGTFAEWQAAMQIDWMTSREIVEAVPPAYSEAIGRCAIDRIFHKKRVGQ